MSLKIAVWKELFLIFLQILILDELQGAGNIVEEKNDYYFELISMLCSSEWIMNGTILQSLLTCDIQVRFTRDTVSLKL